MALGRLVGCRVPPDRLGLVPLGRRLPLLGEDGCVVGLAASARLRGRHDTIAEDDYEGKLEEHDTWLYDGCVVGGIGSSGVSPALQQASLLLADLGWQGSSAAPGVSSSPSWLTTLDAAGTPQPAAGSGTGSSTASNWMTVLDSASTPQMPASPQSTLGQSVDLRL